MKTRKVKVIGRLYLQNKLEYSLIRQEPLAPGFIGQVAGFTVTSQRSSYFPDAETDDDIYYPAPFFVVATQYTIVYNKPYEIKVEIEDEEVDDIDIDIPEPEMTEDEWEHNLNRIDMENPNENSQA